MTKPSPAINAVLFRNKDGSVSVRHRPYNTAKTVKLSEETNDKLLQMAKAKSTSRHAEMCEAIKKHIEEFFEG